MNSLSTLWGESVRWLARGIPRKRTLRLPCRVWERVRRNRYWVKYTDSLVIRVCPTDYVQHEIFLNGFYEEDLIKWVKNELRDDDVFWDIGANIGSVTLIAARNCKQVISFEPTPETIEKLEENVRANRLENVNIQKCALSDRNHEVVMNRGPESNSGMNSIVRPHAFRPGIVVNARRADDLIAEGLPFPNVIKIDVEGAEQVVLEGAPMLLKNPALRAIVFETDVVENGMPDARIVHLLASAGFQIRILGRSDLDTNDGLNNFLATRVER